MEPTTSVKHDVYSIVTDKIIDKLRQGTVPWKQPWQDAGLPMNAITKRPYRGINWMLLASCGYRRNGFLTAKQLKEAGGAIKSSEKPHLVVYWKWLEPRDEEDNAVEGKKKPFLRYYNVFNVEQCEGIDRLIPTDEPRTAHSIEVCEQVVDGMPDPPTIQHVHHRAYYDPATDAVNVPVMEDFRSDEAYYCTLFHELVHATGHPHRLNRKGIAERVEFGSEPYSFEELVAEIGACYLESLTGIAQEQLEQNAAYLQGWLKKFQSDRKFIVLASAAAQKATDFILGISYTEGD